MLTPTERHELQRPTSSALTGYLVKPLRAASLAARLALPEAEAPGIAGDEPSDQVISDPAATSAKSTKGLSILVAEDNEINTVHALHC